MAAEHVSKMRISYYPPTDSSIVYVRRGYGAKSRKINDDIVADLDARLNLLSLDVHACANERYGLNGPDAKQRAAQLVDWARERLAGAAAPDPS